jgi:hypothetical protein
MGSRYTAWIVEMSCPAASAPKSGIKSTSRLMRPIIPTEDERAPIFGQRAAR